MNKQIKQLSKLLFLVIFITFSSCEKDLYEDAIQENHNHNVKISQKSFDELIINKQFKNSYKSIVKNKQLNKASSEGKSAMVDEFGFTISDDLGKVIETDNKTTYIFAITRPNNSDASFENLIIETDTLNQTKAIIAKYTPSVPITLNSQDNIQFTGDLKYSYIQNTTSDPLPCMTVIVSRCNGIPYDCGGSVCGFDTYVGGCSGGGGFSFGNNNGNGLGTSGLTGNSGTNGNSGGTGNTSSTTGNTTSNNLPYSPTYGISGDDMILIQPVLPNSFVMLNMVLPNLTIAQNNWINQHPDVKATLQQYALSENFNPIFAMQMINLAIANNSSFTFNNTLNSTNAMSFNSVAEFQNMLNDMKVIPADITYDPGNGQVTANIKFQLTPFGGGVKIRVLENVGPPRTISEVTSITYGISLGFSWTQTGTPSITPIGNTTTIVVDGILAYNSIFASIGVFNEMEVSYQIVINNTNGTIISAIRLP